MSSYALGAIQMMTPSTFRRRNVTGRLTNNSSNEGLLHGGNLKFKSNLRPSLTKVKGSNRTADLQNNVCPPSTLTFQDQQSASSGNFGLSQLTMSQLSDSMSHCRSLHDRNAVTTSSIRPSKVARTMTQTRPSSARSNVNLNRHNEILHRRQNPKPRQRGMHSMSSRAFSISATKQSSFLPYDKFRRNDDSKQREAGRKTYYESSRQSKTKCDENTQEYSSQPRSQILVLSPPRNNGLSNTFSSNVKSTRIPKSNATNSSVSAPSRKRSWMEACIDVMKTPYRTGKCIANRITTFKVDDDAMITKVPSKVDDDEAFTIHSPCKVHKASSFQTPSRVDNNQLVQPTTRNIQTSSKASSTSKSIATATDSNFQQSRELLLQMEKAKQSVEKERLEFEKSKADFLGEIARQSVILKREKEALEALKKEYQTIRDDCREIQSKFSTHAFTVEGKFSAGVSLLNSKKSDAIEELKQYQIKFTRELEEKKKRISEDFDLKFSSYKITQLGESLQIGTNADKTHMEDMEERVSQAMPNQPNNRKVHNQGLISMSMVSNLPMNEKQSTSKGGFTNKMDLIPNTMKDGDSSAEGAMIRKPVQCPSTNTHEVTVSKTRTKRVSPSKSQSSLARRPRKGNDFITTATVITHGSKHASRNQSTLPKQQRKGIDSTSTIHDYKQASKSEPTPKTTHTTTSSASRSRLNFVSPLNKKRKCARSRSGAKSSFTSSGSYNLRSRKPVSSSSIVVRGDMLAGQCNFSNEHVEARTNIQFTTERKNSESRPSASKNKKNEPDNSNHSKVIKHKSKPSPKKVIKGTTTTTTTMNQTNPDATIKSTVNQRSRRRRRINGRAKLNLSQQGSKSSKDVALASTLSRKRQSIIACTPKNQGITTPSDSAVRRLNRVRQLRQAQARESSSPIGVDCNIELPMLPKLDALVDNMSGRIQASTTLRPRFSCLTHTDNSDSLSFT